MLKYNGRIITKNDRWIGDVNVPLPPSTARFRFSDPTYDPRTEDRWSGTTMAARWSKVQVADNVWDYTGTSLQSFAANGSNPGIWNDRNFNVELLDTNIAGFYYDFQDAFRECNNLVKVHRISSAPRCLSFAFSKTGISEIPLFDTSNVWTLARAFNETSIVTIPLFNTSNVSSLNGTFSNCSNLEYLPNIDTSKVTNVSFALWYCHNLKELPTWDLSKVSNFESFANMDWLYNSSDIEVIPDYDVSSAVNVQYAFTGMTKVKTGIYRLYQKFAALGNQITNHTGTFAHTGIDTEEGRAERALIPQSWGGDLVEE